MYGLNRAKCLCRKSGDVEPADDDPDAPTIDNGCVAVADGGDDGEWDAECDGGGVRDDADTAAAADRNPADNCGGH